MDSGLVKQFNEINEKNERLKEENEKQRNEFVKYRQTVETKHDEYNEYIDKLKEVINKLKENCDRLNKETEHYRNKFTSYQREIEPRYKEEVKKLRQENELYQNELTKYQQVIIPKYNENINNLKKEFSTEVTKLQQSSTCAEKKICEIETEKQNQAIMVKELERLNKDLEVKSEKLRKEASSYQSALRSAESSCYSLRDGDRNDPVQLTNDLRSLQERIERYVTTLKGAVVVDNEKVLELFNKYNLKIEKQTTQDKILMKSVLQRYVLEKVLEYADEYLNNINDDHPCNQEKQIMDHADGLLNILGKFHRNHLIKDNKNKFTTARKIHEQVYGLLGEHGFSDIYDENNDSSNSSNGDDNKQLQSTKHPFVSSAVQKLNALMTEYRLIKDVNKRRYTENMAENIIKDIVRIFRFRLLINEPRFELYWFERNDKIKPALMRGTWDDDCLEDYVVDICFFPLIGTNLNIKDNNKNNDLDCKILAYAKVYPRSIINSQGGESFEVEEKKASSENNNNNGIIANMLKKVIGRHESTDQQNGENQDGNNSISSSVPQDKKAEIPTKNNDGNDNPSLSNNNVNSSKSNDLKNSHQEKKGSNQENEDSDSDDDNYKDLDYDKIDRDESY